MKKCLSQEWLKIIACVIMLIDHIGAVLLPQYIWLRYIGRIAFPIYCFLLAEGVHYTKNPQKYGLRLAAGALLSEIPFDLALFGGVTPYYETDEEYPSSRPSCDSVCSNGGMAPDGLRRNGRCAGRCICFDPGSSV